MKLDILEDIPTYYSNKDFFFFSLEFQNFLQVVFGWVHSLLEIVITHQRFQSFYIILELLCPLHTKKLLIFIIWTFSVSYIYIYIYTWMCWVLVAACGIQFPYQGSNLGCRLWKHRVLATGPPGKSPFSVS